MKPHHRLLLHQVNKVALRLINLLIITIVLMCLLGLIAFGGSILYMAFWPKQILSVDALALGLIVTASLVTAWDITKPSEPDDFED